MWQLYTVLVKTTTIFLAPVRKWQPVFLYFVEKQSIKDRTVKILGASMAMNKIYPFSLRKKVFSAKLRFIQR